MEASETVANQHGSDTANAPRNETRRRPGGLCAILARRRVPVQLAREAKTGVLFRLEPETRYAGE